MKLYIFPPSPRAIKVVAAKNYLQLDCELVLLDYSKAEQRTTEFASINPNRRMPVLEHEGFVLWESNAILHYFATLKPQAGLWPSEARAQADVLRWLFWEGAHWVPACGVLINERIKKAAFRGGTPDEKLIAEAEITVREVAGLLDAHLHGRSWLVGDHVSIADFSLASWFVATNMARFPIGQFESIRLWYGRVRALPGWREALPCPPYTADFDIW